MIYTITTLKTVYGYKNPAHQYELGTRTVGFFYNIKHAIEIVEENHYDIYENGYYPFCVIEAIDQGVYNVPENEYWYQWIDGKYRKIDKPESLKHIVGFWG